MTGDAHRSPRAAAPPRRRRPTGEHAAHGEMDYDQMTDAMLDTMAAFPAETEGIGNQLLEPTEVLADGTKVFDLTMELADWEVAPGKVVEAWTFNGMVPAPMMRPRGRRQGARCGCRTTCPSPPTSTGTASTSTTPTTASPRSPRTSSNPARRTRTTSRPTSRRWRCTTRTPTATCSCPTACSGRSSSARCACPLGQTVGLEQIPADLTVSQEIPMVLNDAGVIGYSLNGKSFPATQPYTAKVGDWVLIHYFNEGTQIHPMHLHQFDQIVVAKDGYPLDAPVHGRHAQRGPRRALLGAREPRRARRLGVALPHPPPRRARGGHVRDGHRLHRRVAGTNVPPIRPERLCRSTAEHRSMQAMTTSLDVLMIESDPGIAVGTCHRTCSKPGIGSTGATTPSTTGSAAVGSSSPSTCPLEQHVDVAFVARDGVNPAHGPRGRGALRDQGARTDRGAGHRDPRSLTPRG